MSSLRLISVGNGVSKQHTNIISCSHGLITRRRILQSFTVAPMIFHPSSDHQRFLSCYAQSKAKSADLIEREDSVPKFIKQSNGIRIQELESGTGQAASVGDVVVVDYVLRRSNGYFIYSTVEGVSFQPRDVPIGPISFQLGDSNFISGLNDTITGMKIGGRRRVLMPPELAYQDNPLLEPQPPSYSGKRQIQSHSNEPFLFEVELLKIRTIS